MSNEGQDKTAQRFSRYSRSDFEDISSSRATAEASMAEITARALSGLHRASARSEPMRGGWDQPPPPEPTAFWREDERPTAAQPVVSSAAAPVLPPPERISDTAVAPQTSSDAMLRDMPTEPPPARDMVLEDPALEPVVEFSVAPSPDIQEKGPGLTARTAANAATLAREKAVPALTKAALWLAQNLRRREIRKRYNRLLVFGHTRIADRKVEELFFVPSRKAEMIEPASDQGIHYDGPVAASAFRWVMSMVPDDLRQFAFIDIRAGRGRTALLATGHGFKHIHAYEWDTDTFDDLQMNVAQYPRSRMVCRKIDCHRGDVDGIALPDQPCVIWFSGAWREQLIPGVMDYVQDTYRQSPRRIYIVLENVAPDTVVHQDAIFDAVEPPLSEKLKLRLLSPVDFRVYRSTY
jgi:16S rRNA G966 N2-methylase RsmD